MQEAGFARTERRLDLAGMERVVSDGADGRRGCLDRARGRGAARGALERCVTSGGVGLFPADGLYGLACDPMNAEGIDRIHEIKGRDDGKPSAVMYFDPLVMRELFADLGPLTVRRSRLCSRARSPSLPTIRRIAIRSRAAPRRSGWGSD